MFEYSLQYDSKVQRHVFILGIFSQLNKYHEFRSVWMHSAALKGRLFTATVLLFLSLSISPL